MNVLLLMCVFYVTSVLSQDENQPGDLYLQYRILEVDTIWRSLDSLNQQLGSGISGGRYNVQIRSINRNSGETRHISDFSIEIPKFFWERISFWWLHIIVFLFLFWLIRRYEIKNKYISKKALLEKRKVVENERIRIARDFHDGAGSSLVQSLILTEVAKEKIKNGEIEKACSDLTLIADIIKNLDELLRDIIWSLDPNNNSVQEVVIFFKNYSTGFLKGKNLKFETNITPQAKEFKLTSEFRRNVFFIIKEVLTNICKHSRANNVNIWIDMNAKEFKLRIQDDGVGFDSHLQFENSRTQKGITNIYARAKALDGNLIIKSESGKGTEIFLNVPEIEMHII